MSTTLQPAAALPLSSARWLQLGLGLLCMMAISSPQYVWTLFTKPLGASLSAPAAAIQVTFSILIVLQTFFSPFQGWLVERFGPRSADRSRRRLDGAELGLGVPGLIACRAVCHLRPSGRAGHRHRLYRRRRADGGLVSRPARVRSGRRRCRLWHRRGADELPDCRQPGGERLWADAAAVRPDPGRGRGVGRAGPACAAGGAEGANAAALHRSGREHRHDASQSHLLADVRHVYDDVHLWADGHGSDRALRQRPGHQQAGDLGLRGDPADADGGPRLQRPDPAVLRLGVRPDRPGEHDGPGLSGWRALQWRCGSPPWATRCCSS